MIEMLYMHAYIPETKDSIETVWCAAIDKYEFDGNAIILHHSRTADGKERLDRSSRSIHPMVEGSRFWLVDNNPGEVQAPNGPIIWKWPSA